MRTKIPIKKAFKLGFPVFHTQPERWVTWEQACQLGMSLDNRKKDGYLKIGLTSAMSVWNMENASHWELPMSYDYFMLSHCFTKQDCKRSFLPLSPDARPDGYLITSERWKQSLKHYTPLYKQKIEVQKAVRKIVKAYKLDAYKSFTDRRFYVNLAKVDGSGDEVLLHFTLPKDLKNQRLGVLASSAYSGKVASWPFAFAALNLLYKKYGLRMALQNRRAEDELLVPFTPFMDLEQGRFDEHHYITLEEYLELPLYE